MADNIEHVFINLNVLAKIQPGDKLIVSEDGLLNIDTSLFPMITRWWKGISRTDVLQTIGQVLTQAFALNEQWIAEKNANMLFRLTSDLKNALLGLNHLQLTYPDDKLVESEIDVMMENIRTKLYSNYPNEKGQLNHQKMNSSC